MGEISHATLDVGTFMVVHGVGLDVVVLDVLLVVGSKTVSLNVHLVVFVHVGGLRGGAHWKLVKVNIYYNRSKYLRN